MRRVPGFVERDPAEDLVAECAPYVGMSIECKCALVDAAARAAADLVRAHPDAARILDWQDPLPESSVRIWQRLRRATGRAA